MKIAAPLPNPYGQTPTQERSPVPAVRAPNRARDAADEPEPRQPQVLSSIVQSERERLAAAINTGRDRQPAESLRADRALASYAAVADDGERAGLRDLLGFDAYA